MGPKVQQDKLAWLWAETTDPENISIDHRESAYRIKLKPCNRVSGQYVQRFCEYNHWLQEISNAAKL